MVNLAQDLELGRVLERAREDAGVDEIALADATVALAAAVRSDRSGRDRTSRGGGSWPVSTADEGKTYEKNWAMIGAAGREKLSETASQRS